MDIQGSGNVAGRLRCNQGWTGIKAESQKFNPNVTMDGRKLSPRASVAASRAAMSRRPASGSRLSAVGHGPGREPALSHVMELITS